MWAKKTAPLFRTQRQTRFLLCPSLDLGNWQSVESPQKISSNSLLLKLYDQNITKNEISQIRVNSTQVCIMSICCPSVTENPKLEIFSLSGWSPLRTPLLIKLFWRLLFSMFNCIYNIQISPVSLSLVGSLLEFHHNVVFGAEAFCSFFQRVLPLCPNPKK